MDKCIRCKEFFDMPKGRTFCLLCDDCRAYALYGDMLEVKTFNPWGSRKKKEVKEVVEDV